LLSFRLRFSILFLLFPQHRVTTGAITPSHFSMASAFRRYGRLLAGLANFTFYNFWKSAIGS
jgi:hypothetical protein